MRLRINGETWKVIRHRGLRKRGFDGACYSNTRRIAIAAHLTGREYADTLLHEILHAVWPSGVVSDELEEDLVRRITPRLLRVIHHLPVARPARRVGKR